MLRLKGPLVQQMYFHVCVLVLVELVIAVAVSYSVAFTAGPNSGAADDVDDVCNRVAISGCDPCVAYTTIASTTAEIVGGAVAAVVWLP